MNYRKTGPLVPFKTMLYFLTTGGNGYDLLSPKFLIYNRVKMEVSFRHFFSLHTSSSIGLNFVDIGWP